MTGDQAFRYKGAGWLQDTGCMTVGLGGLIVCYGSGRSPAGMGRDGGGFS